MLRSASAKSKKKSPSLGRQAATQNAAKTAFSATLRWTALAGFVLILFFFALVSLTFPVRYRAAVKDYSTLFNVDSRLVYAVIWTESKFDKRAVSRSGAVGLMQLMPATAEWCAGELNENYSKKRLTEPNFNIKLGTFYLSYLIGKYGEDGAIAAYNAGEGNYIQWQGKIEFKETRDYIKRVSFARKIYNLKIN